MPSAEHERTLERLGKWAVENTEDTLLESLAKEGLVRLIKEIPGVFLGQVETWLSADKVNLKLLGLRALTVQLTSAGFENLPAVYRLLGPVMGGAGRKLRPYLLDVVVPLAERSPSETAYFLRQCLQEEDSQTIRWVIRQSMDAFPADIQESLKRVMRKE